MAGVICLRNCAATSHPETSVATQRTPFAVRFRAQDTTSPQQSRHRSRGAGCLLCLALPSCPVPQGKPGSSVSQGEQRGKWGLKVASETPAAEQGRLRVGKSKSPPYCSCRSYPPPALAAPCSWGSPRPSPPLGSPCTTGAFKALSSKQTTTPNPGLGRRETLVKALCFTFMAAGRRKCARQEASAKARGCKDVV